MTDDNKRDGMLESPLLNKKTPPRSTIRPEKLEQSRFTERRQLEEDGSAVKIIVYVIVVILIGVGAAFLIRTLITRSEDAKNDQEQEQQEETADETPTTNDAFTVSTTTKADSEATSLAPNASYREDIQVVLGATSSQPSTLDTISYEKYTTFERTVFNLSTASLPKTTIKYDAAKNTVIVILDSTVTVDSELKTTLEPKGLVTSITYAAADNSFTLALSEESKYRVVESSGDLFVDIKTVEELEAPEEEETTPTPTPVATPTPAPTPTPTSTDKPTAPHLTNDFSQKQQYLVTTMTGAKVGLNNYYYWDEGTFFEFSWGQQGSVGTDKVPNATAYLKEESSKSFIYVEIENLNAEVFTLNGITGTNLSSKLNTSGANFVRVDLIEYKNNKATYKIELKKKADFKLLSQKTYAGDTQIVSIQIKD